MKVGHVQPFEALDLAAMFALPRPRYRIEGLLPERGLALLFGASNSYKSFLAVDIACHVALGQDWHGHKTHQCGVIYVAGEGAYGLATQRVPGWHLHHGFEDSNPPLRLVPVGVDVTDNSPAGQISQLMATIGCTVKETEGPIGLVVIDTLARSFGSRNENSPDDMAAFLMGISAIEQATQGAVLVVHHTGWTAKDRSRGHSSLWGAADTRLAINGDPDHRCTTMKLERQKDGDSGKAFHFIGKRITVGTDSDGLEVSTLVLEPSDKPTTTTKPVKLTPDQDKVLGLLQNFVIGAKRGPDGLTWMPRPELVKKSLHRGVDGAGNNPKKPYRVIDQLEKKGLMYVEDNKVRLTNGS